MRKKDVTSGTSDWGSAPAGRITPQEVQEKEFQVARFGAGYRMREVDEFLDQVTEALSALVAENERLLRGSADRGTPTVPPTSDDSDRAAVETFLRREKGFLQDLGALVQDHAEELRSMVRAARKSPGAAVVATSEAKAPEEPASAPVVIPAAIPQAADTPNGPTEEAAAEPDPMDTSERATSPADPADDEPTEGEGEVSGGSGTIAGAVADEPIRLDEPEPARSGRSDEEEDGSLRELFWGEE